MNEEQKQVEGAKKPKTYEEAFSELKGFILQSRKEEAEKTATQQQEKHK